MVECMRVSAVFERLWLVKKLGGKLINFSFEIPHETLPSNVRHKRRSNRTTLKFNQLLDKIPL